MGWLPRSVCQGSRPQALLVAWRRVNHTSKRHIQHPTSLIAQARPTLLETLREMHVHDRFSISWRGSAHDTRRNTPASSGICLGWGSSSMRACRDADPKGVACWSAKSPPVSPLRRHAPRVLPSRLSVTLRRHAVSLSLRLSSPSPRSLSLSETLAASPAHLRAPSDSCVLLWHARLLARLRLRMLR